MEAKPRSIPATPATVFVANGAGNFQMTSRALEAVLRKDGYPIEVQTHDWSHGNYRILADQIDFEHARAEGERLAVAVLSYRKAYPDRPIFLLAHSAGSTTVLAALENLPANVVERAILLSPSQSSEYDLAEALRAVKTSLHVFYSPLDYYYLGLATHLVGTTDRRFTSSAGRCGFLVTDGVVAPALGAKLIQRPWRPADCLVGNNGGHYGCYQPGFLRAHVIPLFEVP